jgi:dTDP-4-dehydrorhamnose reductase
MNIVLLGQNGQVGWELQRSLSVLGPLQALDRHSQPCGDLSQPEALHDHLLRLQPDVIVNAAAYTAVDQAQAEPELARLINAAAPAAMARAAHALGATLVHYSSDYVFNGQGTRAWRESDAVAPLNVYGQTKREGEEAILSSGCDHLILRTSWVHAVRGHNFAHTMLRLAQERDQLKVIHDQWGAPTSAELIADVTAQVLRQCQVNAKPKGLYHLVAGGETTWHGYACHLIEQARLLRPDLPWRVQEILPVPSSAYPTVAQRPHNSRLDTSQLQQVFGLVLPDWRVGVDRMLNETLLRG